VVVSWKKEGLLLAGATAHERLDMASGLDEPGQGPTPMELLAASLADCTSMDVISILQKMRQPLEDLRVEVRGERPMSTRSASSPGRSSTTSRARWTRTRCGAPSSCRRRSAARWRPRCGLPSTSPRGMSSRS